MKTKPKLLAVDDEDFNLDIMECHLTKAGFDVILAEDGAVALERLEQNPDVKVIVLDRMMPNMNGMEFLERVRNDERYQDIPVVMQTAAAMTDQVLQGVKAGVYYYLTKPYKASLLVGIVQSALEDAHNKKRMKEEVRKGQLVFGLMRQSSFRFRTLDEAKALALYIANCFPNPQEAVYGLHELLINAIEHGNLGITYDEKTNLVLRGELQNEIERRLASERYKDRVATVTFSAMEESVSVTIKDEGEGFEWRKYLELDSSRMTNPNGRGIATARTFSFHNMEYLGCGNEVVCKCNFN
ncbi:MAG: response regulator [Rhodomicrobium sp.]|jgi:CheY-like chemotaxis protein